MREHALSPGCSRTACRSTAASHAILPFPRPPPRPHSQKSPTGWNIAFQICGSVSYPCVPNYQVTYNYGTAIQFIDDVVPPGNCTNTLGQSVPCTVQCEVIGTGPPIIETMDPTRPWAGVNVSYYGISDNSLDGHLCPINPITQGPFDRNFKVQLVCNESADTPVILTPTEPSSCVNLAVLRCGSSSRRVRVVHARTLSAPSLPRPLF